MSCKYTAAVLFKSILKSKLCYSKTAFRGSKLRRTEKVLGSTNFINNVSLSMQSLLVLG